MRAASQLRHITTRADGPSVVGRDPYHGQDESTDSDDGDGGDRDGGDRDGGGGDGKDGSGEEDPEPAAHDDADRHAEDDPDDGSDRCLPADGGR